MALIEAQPLYAKVQGVLTDRLIKGFWKAGQMLPSEFAIADELSVSQGTVRKALDKMVQEGLLYRKQGRGTFVAEAEDQSILFRFYRLTPNESLSPLSPSSFPQSHYLSRIQDQASDEECALFDLNQGEQVWRFERLRSNEKGPILWEKLILPCSRFIGFGHETELPNNVYQFYSQNWGIIVAKVKEELRAITAPLEISQLLDLPPQAPLLEIDRRAIALDGKVVEWRLSLCRSDTMHYRNELK